MPREPLIKGRKGRGKWWDILLFLLGGLAIYGMIYQFGFGVYDYGLPFVWFMLMAFASGMIGFLTLVVASALIAAGASMMVETPGRPAA